LSDSVDSSRPLAGKTALVTGAARGVGKVIAVELGRLGATVLVSARTVDAGGLLAGTIGDTVAQIEAEGSSAHALQADLLDAASTAHLIEEVNSKFGGVDILVNNAAETGPLLFQDFWQTDPAGWRRQIDLNLTSMYDLMHAFVPGMRERRSGTVINIGSVQAMPEGTAGAGGIGGSTIGAAYPTTKVAIYTLTTLLAAEFAKFNIVAFTLTPGAARTERFEETAGRIGFDADLGVSPELTGQTVRHILTSANPMDYAGRFISAPDFVAAL
jgi:NAD(P)-dependent dehydrogenase (short-subunit alcohol dehydrogenase family)